jgi:hypothetical protein
MLNEELLSTFKNLIFICETAAHLQGMEKVILPTTDAAKVLMKKIAEECVVIDIGEVVKNAWSSDELTEMAAGPTYDDGWSNNLIETLETTYGFETKVTEFINAHYGDQ